MQRRYRVFTGQRRRRGLLWVPPSAPVTGGPVPALIRQHRKARLQPHHRHGHPYWTPPVTTTPPGTGVVFTAGDARWWMTAGAARNT